MQEARTEKKSANNKKRSFKLQRKNSQSIDYTLLFVILMLLLFGLIMVFSSSYYYALTRPQFGYDMYYFLKRQGVFAVIGLAAMIIIAYSDRLLDYRTLRKVSPLIYLVSLGLLVLVLIIGEDINGSKRWLDFGFFSFQPSELAKYAVILYLPHFILSKKGRLNSFMGFIICCIVLAVPFGLVLIENMSTALVIAAVGAAILFVASPKIWYFLVPAVIGTGGLALALFLPKYAYRLDRIKYMFDPFSDPLGKGFQVIQSLYAVASGGIFGLGLGQSRQKTYIPEPYNDIIFAIICEELGMVGAAVLILLFIVLIWRGLKIAMNAKDMYASLVAAGISSLIGVQVIINIAVATNTFPNTGMQLPFISYGGTGLLATLGGMGILLNISRNQRKK